MHFFAPINGPKYEISNNVVCASTKGLDQPAHMRSLIRAFASRLKTIDRLADPPGKSQVIVILVYIEISIWTPPLEKVAPPLENV